MVVARLGQAKLREDAADVLLDGALGHPELARYSRVRVAFRHQCEHLALAIGQVSEWVFLPPGGHQQDVLGTLAPERPNALRDLMLDIYTSSRPRQARRA